MLLVFGDELLERIIDPLNVVHNDALTDDGAGVAGDVFEQAANHVGPADPLNGAVNLRQRSAGAT
jgi:hypothetical protein